MKEKNNMYTENEMNKARIPAEPDYSLAGRRALVTGSSRGIGSAIAMELARKGADVYVHCFENTDKAKEVSSAIRALGRQSWVKCADLCDISAVQALAAQLNDVDILVLNASVQIQKPWKDITPEEFYKQVNCNYLASLLLIQAAAGHMQEHNWGRIVTIGSVQQKKPCLDMLVYSSSKCAQFGLTHSLAIQLAPFGITVNNLAPGVISTDRNTVALSDRQYSSQLISSIPLGYFGEKEDIAGMVSLLCSEAGRYITGQDIYLDGGKSL